MDDNITATQLAEAKDKAISEARANVASSRSEVETLQGLLALALKRRMHADWVLYDLTHPSEGSQ